MYAAQGLRTLEFKKPSQVPATYGRWGQADADLEITQDDIRMQQDLVRRKKVEPLEEREEPCQGPEAR